jgi:hypothetical protein
MKKQIIMSVAILTVLVFAGSYFFSKKNPKLAEIGGHKFKLELAVNGKERERGLGGRESLCRDCAMLFVFPQEGAYSFWMKDMRFNLDIIWVSDGKIVQLAKNVDHGSLATITPKKPANLVLEINAGLSDEYGLKEDDRVNFSY